MPVLPNVPKVLRLDLVMTKGSDANVRDRIFLQFTGAGPTTTDLTTLSNSIATAWTTNIQPLQDAATTLTSINLTDLTSPTGAQIQSGRSFTGSRTGSGLPGAVSPVIKFKINRRYRGGHPRMYLPAGVGTDTSTAQLWTSTFTSLLATNWAAFISALTASPPTNLGTLAHVNVSYFTGFINKTFPSGRTRPVPVLRGTPLIDTIATYSVNPKFGSQRRRNLQSP